MPQPLMNHLFVVPIVTTDSLEAGAEMATGEKIEMANSDPMYFDSWVTDIKPEDYGKLADAVRNIPKDRCIEPRDYRDYIQYKHRNQKYSDVDSHLRIGDSYFQLPPSFIGVFDRSDSEQIGSIRQTGSLKVNQGHGARDIMIHLFFNGYEQINGFEVDGPMKDSMTYYVDGLRPLIAQFHTAPFLPIENSLLNSIYGIFAVALSSINVQTMEGFPGCLEVILNLIEFNTEPYTEMPSMFFDDLFEWDLYRYGYQRLLNPNFGQLYLPEVSSEVNRYEDFKFSVLDPETFDSDKYDQIGDLTAESFYKEVISNKDDIHLLTINFGLTNIFPSIQMEDHVRPVLQYMGSSDALVSLVFETMDTQCLTKIEEMMSISQALSLAHKRYNKVGYVRFKNELTQLCGTEYFVINSIESTTVPEFPGLYRIAISMIGFDIRQDKKGLDGSRPFNRKGTMDDAISQTMEGLINKVEQDNYIERRMMNDVELYPDLYLPSFYQLDSAILRINNFRKTRGLEPLPYKRYPREESIVPGKDLQGTYEGYVDPDYYLFYPMRYSELDQEAFETVYQAPNPTPDPVVIPDTDYGEEYVQDARLGMDTTGTDTVTTVDGITSLPNTIAGSIGNPDRQAYVDVIVKQQGSLYETGGKGEITSSGKRKFDCSGLVCWGMWQLGNWMQADGRTYYMNTTGMYQNRNSSYFRQISESELIPGDICLLYGVAGKANHVGVYIGTDAKGKKITMEAQTPKIGVAKGVVSYYNYFLRPKVFEKASNSSGFYDVDRSELYNVTRLENYDYHTIEGDETLAYDTTSSTNSVRMDLRFDAKVTVKVLNSILQKGLAGKGKDIRAAAQKWNVDAALLAAITMLESGHGTSKAFTYYNNPSGTMDPATNWQKPMVFPTLQSGLEYTAKNLSNNYIGIGLNTIQKIGNKYCPIGAKNDPNGLNKNWVPTVTGFFNKIKSAAYGADISTLPVSDSSSSSNQDVYGNELTDNSRETPNTSMYGYIKVNGSSDFKQTKAGEKVQDKKVTLSVKSPITVHKASAYVSDTASTSKQKQGQEKLSGRFIQTIADLDLGLEAGSSGTSESASSVKVEMRQFAKPYVCISPVLKSLVEDKEWIDIYQAMTQRTSPWDTYGMMDQALNDTTKIGQLENEIRAGRVKVPKESEMIKECLEGNMMERMCVDMVEFNRKGRLCRAFPTYCFMIVDDGGEWLDGRKLWSNYYYYRSVMKISVFQESAQPIHTAEITINDAYHELSKAPKYPAGLYQKTKIENDTDYGSITRWWYKLTGSLLGGPKLTENMVDIKNYIHETIDIRPGCRIHIRMGYGSNPIKLPVMFNGIVADIENYGSMIRLVGQSDGHELLGTVVSANPKDKNWYGKLQSEPSNIIASLLTDRNNAFTNSINKKWGEPSKYGIENFGLNFGGADANINQAVQRDIVKNIYLGRNDCHNFSEHFNFALDKEKNFTFSLYGKYPWDCMQMCAQFMPEFVCQPVYHQFESRVFYGLPYFPYRYRYDLLDHECGKRVLYEHAKSFGQFHTIDSMCDIVRNRMKATSRDLKTNIVALYSIGRDGASKKTPVLYSDRTIDWSKQSTKIIDTTVMQNYLGPDKLYSYFQLNTGKSAAIKIGLANLIDGWEKTYAGEIITLGNAPLKPCDYIHLDDGHHHIKGIVKVRAVTHCIDGETGFTTSIVPGMIATSNISYTGTTNVTKGMFTIGGAIHSGTNVKKFMNFQAATMGASLWNAKVISWIGAESAEMKIMTYTAKFGKQFWNHFKTGKVVSQTKSFYNYVHTSYEALDSIKDIKDTVKAVKASTAVVKTLNMGKNALVLASNVVPIVGPIVIGILSDIAINVLCEFVMDWVGYRNCISIVPLYKQGSPFCVGTKGAQNLIYGGTSSPITNDSFDYEEEQEIELS